MFTIENPFLWLVGLPAIGILIFLLRGRFRADTQARRRGQSHRPEASQQHGPTVRPAAGKQERDRNR